MIELPMSRMPHVFNTMQIPEEYLSVFWVALRRELQFTRRPDAISLQTLRAVLIRVLRFIRDKYTVKMSREKLVQRNNMKIEDEYETHGVLGAGSFGQCSIVTHRVTGTKRVVKSIGKDLVNMAQDEMEKEMKSPPFTYPSQVGILDGVWGL